MPEHATFSIDRYADPNVHIFNESDSQNVIVFKALAFKRSHHKTY